MKRFDCLPELFAVSIFFVVWGYVINFYLKSPMTDLEHLKRTEVMSERLSEKHPDRCFTILFED